MKRDAIVDASNVCLCFVLYISFFFHIYGTINVIPFFLLHVMRVYKYRFNGGYSPEPCYGIQTYFVSYHIQYNKRSKRRKLTICFSNNWPTNKNWIENGKVFFCCWLNEKRFSRIRLWESWDTLKLQRNIQKKKQIKDKQIGLIV